MTPVRVRPSAAGVWAPPDGCRLYPSMIVRYPETEPSQDAKEGTACHEIAAHMVTHGLHAQPFTDFVGTSANNGIVIDQAMQDAAELYAGIMLELCRDAAVFTQQGHLMIEQPICMRHLHPENYGTPDFWLFNVGTYTIHLADFKYGHRIIDPFECWQLLNYLAGVVKFLQVNMLIADQITVVFHVVQPRGYAKGGVHRTWTFKLSDAMHHFDTLAQSAAECNAPNPVARVGNHCLDCPGRHSCEALADACGACMDYAGQSDPVDLKPFEVGLELMHLERAAKLIESKITGLEEQALHYIQNGQVVAGKALENTYGFKAWSKPDAEIIALGSLFDLDFRSPKPTTPSKAIALAKESTMPSVILDDYTHKPATGVKLVSQTHKMNRRTFSV